MNRFWKYAGIGATIGLLTGFAVPMAASLESAKSFVPPPSQMPHAAILVIPTLTPPPVAMDRDSEIFTLKAKNKRLEALVATLRRHRSIE